MEGGDLRMSNIDERVVEMQFDNKQFEEGVKSTLATLDALNKALKLEGATKGLENVSAAAGRFSLGGIGAGVETIAGKFKNLGIVGVTALANITTQAVMTGERMLKSLTLEHLSDGLHVYETKINAIQTILANTASEGTKLPQVTAALAELNKYANLTVFSFGDMAKNIGTFTAAGVDLKTSVASIKGIANLAALSGSSADQASTAMYQLSQAIAAGSVKLQDWNSVVNAGMGGKVFQTALENTARAMGVHIDTILKKAGSFRQSLQEGWITSDVLTKTLAQFTGDLSAAQLKAMGFSDQEAKSILAMGQAAVKSATDIRTVTQLQAALKEEVATAWASVWETLIGNITDATALLSNVHNVLENAFTKPVYALNTLLQGWAKLGGRTALIDAISNAFKAFGAVIKPIKDAFHEIFPPATAEQLYKITLALEAFTKKLIIGGATADKIKRTFAGVFAIFGIVIDVVKGLIGVIVRLFSTATQGSGKFLDITAKIGDFFVNLKKSIENGTALTEFFTVLGNILVKPIVLMREFAHWVATAFESVGKDVPPAIAKMGQALTPLEKLGQRLQSIWTGIKKVFDKIVSVVKPVGQAIGNFFRDLVKKIQDSFGGINYNTFLDALNAGLLTGIILLIRKFLKNGFKIDFSGGLFAKIKEAFEGLTKVLSAMQAQIKANALLKIAGAIALLTASVVVLSLIDSAKLTAASAALGAMFAELFTSMAVFEKISGSKGFVKMPFVTASMILLAGAVDLMTIAMAKLAKLDWNGISKGLTGITVIMATMTASVRLMPKEGLISTGAGLILMAVSLNIFASAAKSFAAISWADMAKGLVGVGAVMAALALVSKTMDTNKGGLLEDVEFVLLAASVKILALAVAQFAKLDWVQIAKGLVTMAGAIGIMAVAMNLIPASSVLGGAGLLIASLALVQIAKGLSQLGKMGWGAIGKGLVAMLGSLTILTLALALIPPTAPLGAAGLLIAAIALLQIANVMNKMGQMSWGAIGKAMVGLAGSLLIIGVAVTLMVGALPGAAALIVITAALIAFLPVLLALSKMSWGTILGGMGKLAAALVILGLTSAILAPFVPLIILLGAALIAFSVGLAIAGLAVLAFGVGLTLLSKLGADAANNIKQIVLTMLGLLPEVAKALGVAVIAFAGVIAKAGPAILAAITTILLALMNAIIKLTPKIVQTLGVLLDAMISLAIKYIPKFVDAGLKILIGMLQGVANNIGRVVDTATLIITNFLAALGRNLPKIVDAGFKMIIAFVNGLADAINKNVDAMRQAGMNLAMAIINGMTGGLLDGRGHVADAARAAAQAATNAIKQNLGINSPSKVFMEIGKNSVLGLAQGIDKNSGMVETSATNLAKASVDSMAKALSTVSDKVGPSMDFQPVITPVVDMTNVTDGAGQINRVLAGTVPIDVSTSRTHAVSASIATGGGSPSSDGAQPTQNGNVIFNQYNSSPKALSTAEVYRNTKNQLSIAKTKLAPKGGGE
jgi:tape measure domain-containing protein